MRHSLTLLSLLALLGACSSDPAPATSDVSGPNDVAEVGTATDTATADLGSDTSSAVDMATAADSGPDLQVADMSTGDVGTDTANPEDMADASNPPDMSDPFAGRPTGQCSSDADCPVGPNGQMCSRALPGGACLGCGSDADCPNGTSCSMFAACVTDCSTDDDCPPGLECLGSGRCAALSCAADVCPVALFACNGSNRCERADCSADPNVCPAQTTCVDGRCIEDRALTP